LPHGLVTAFGAIAAYVYKDHAARDDARFAKVADGLLAMNAKLDSALAKQADNHAEILKILLDRARS
jgi:hypothetical protein